MEKPIRIFSCITCGMIEHHHTVLQLVRYNNIDDVSGRVLWSREEALSSVLSVEFVDLPVSQIMAKMEDEFGAEGGWLHLLICVCLVVVNNY